MHHPLMGLMVGTCGLKTQLLLPKLVQAEHQGCPGSMSLTQTQHRASGKIHDLKVSMCHALAEEPANFTHCSGLMEAAMMC